MLKDPGNQQSSDVRYMVMPLNEKKSNYSFIDIDFPENISIEFKNRKFPTVSA